MSSINDLLATAANDLAANSDSARLDAEVLLAWLLKKSRSYLRAWCDKPLTEQQIKDFQQLITQRKSGIPIAYLTAQREFWSREFKVSPAVLIPRPDTELLIELCLDLIAINESAKLIDLGTGSGIIAITLAAERPLLKVIATDYSWDALAIAKENASTHAVNNIAFYHSDWFDKIEFQEFDIIVSNPPYIDKADEHLNQGDVRFEPKSALIAEDNGLSDIKMIADKARFYLKDKGYLLIEHGYNQADLVKAIFSQLGYSHVITHYDLAQQPRVTMGQFLK
jgi:release factor glutamine methyltransferase